MSDWIIRTKLAPSMVSKVSLDRVSLSGTLDQVLNTRLVILHAPAGFGKTTLLTAWHDSVIDRAIPIGWLSLDDKDKDLSDFLMYIGQACQVGGLIRKDELPSLPAGIPGSPPSEYVASLATALGKNKQDIVLVIDDYHRAHTLRNSQMLNQLISIVPSNVHFIVSTREYPSALELADLRARDQLVEIDGSSMRFSEAEIYQYLSSLVDLSDETNWAATLFERTEGWPIALNTVRRWIIEGVSLEDTLRQISGRSSDLSDYFLEQVFDALDETTQEFLLKTSFLERVSGDLANHLCGVTNGWEILEDLERKDLFVQALDRERHWYRYHRLFAEFLQERMRRHSVEKIADLHVSASHWFRTQSFESEAVHHALESGRWDVVAELFEALGGWHYGLRGHMDALERAVALLGEQRLTHFPRLWLAKVYLALRHGEIEIAGRIQCELMDFIDRNASNDVELDSELSILRSVVNVYADNSISDEEIQGLELLGEVLLGDNDLMHALRCNLLCAMYAQRGNFSECMVAGDKAIRHFRAMGSVFGETFIYFHEGYASLQQGRVRDAQALYEVGHDLAMDHFGPGSDLVAIASAFLAETAYETNNLHRASQFLSVALPHIERSDAWLEVYIAAYTTAMKLSRSKFALMSAQEVRERARSTAASRGLRRLGQIVDLQMVELEQWEFLESGVGLHEPRTVELPTGPVEHPTIRQLRVTVAARALISQGNATAAIELLENERSICSEMLLLRPFVSFMILLCVAYRNADQLDKSIEAFEAALSPSLFEGIKRPFINEGSLLVGFLKAFTERSHSRRGNRLRDRFVAELAMEINSNKLIDDDSDSLSPREREILRHIVQGRSNREICEEMLISINTVKFHVKNVYEKLGVSDRKEAVNASIRRGVT